MSWKLAVTASAIAVAVALAGCGLGAGKGTSGVTVTVTRDFGGGSVGSVADKNVAGSQTVMRLLERSFKVTTRYGGGFVESIAGLSGSSARRDWFYYVNRVEGTQGAAGAPGRPDGVGPARLERDRLDPGCCRLVSRAVHARHRRPAPAHHARVRRR